MLCLAGFAAVMVALVSALGVACTDAASSHLTFVEVQRDGVGGVDGFGGAISVTISPDGKHLYAVGRVGDAVAVFSRDSATDALTFVEVQRDGVEDVDGLDDAFSVAIAPDGTHLYVTGRADDAIAVFSRNSTTGALTYLEAYRDGARGVDGLDDVVSVALSPDGRHLYTAGRDGDAVAVFTRDSTTGALTFVEVHKYRAGSGDGLNGATSVTVSPDGKHVYAAGGGDTVRSSSESQLSSASLERPNAVAMFSRDSTTGALTFVEKQHDGVGGVDGLFLIKSVTVAPDGKLLYAAGGGDDAVAVFSRNTTTGALTFVEKQQDSVRGVDGLDGAISLTLSPDGMHLYTAGVRDNAVAVFGVANPAVVTSADSK